MGFSTILRHQLSAALLAAGVLGGLFVAPVRAADDAAAKSSSAGGISGILIDKHCGEKALQKEHPQKIATQHPKSCAVKCADSGYGLMTDGKFIPFDDNGNKLAAKYLADEDNGTRVTVEGKQESGKLAVTSIKAAPEEKSDTPEKSDTEKPDKSKKKPAKGSSASGKDAGKSAPTTPNEK